MSKRMKYLLIFASVSSLLTFYCKLQLHETILADTTLINNTFNEDMTVNHKEMPYI